MSRIAKSPVEVPTGVETKLADRSLTLKGSKGTLALPLNQHVEIKQKIEFFAGI